MKVVPTLDRSEKLVQLGVDCINKSIEAISQKGSRFRFRDMDSIEMLIKNLNDLDVSIEIKNSLFDNLLPEFSDAVEPISELVNL